MCAGSRLSFWFPVPVAPRTTLRGSSGVTLTATPDEIAATRVHQTWVGGHRVYQA